MSAPAALQHSPFDPLCREVPLPIEVRLSVAGFPLLIATNDSGAANAARDAWGQCEPRFSAVPFELRIVVQPGASAGEPVFRSQSSLLTIVSGRENFGAADLTRGFGFLTVSERTVEDTDRFRWSYLESIVYTMLACRAATPLHAGCVERGGWGLLLCGPSGAGKSTLALACARRGWNFVSDEASFLVREGRGCVVAGRTGSVRLRADAGRWFDGMSFGTPEPHPNGKQSIEVALDDRPEIRRSAFCAARGLVRLRRGSPARRIRRIAAEPVVAELLAEVPWFGPEVRQRHERDIASAARRGVWQLEYDTPGAAVDLLDRLDRSHDV